MSDQTAGYLKVIRQSREDYRKAREDWSDSLPTPLAAFTDHAGQKVAYFQRDGTTFKCRLNRAGFWDYDTVQILTPDEIVAIKRVILPLTGMNIKVYGNGGMLFDDSLEQFHDNFFTNTDLDTIRSWAREQGYTIVIVAGKE